FSEIMRARAFGELGDQRYVEYVEDIHHSGSLLISLINDLLDISKVEAGKVELRLETFPLRPLIADVATTSQPLIAKNENTIQVNCPDDIGHMRADLTKVRQILINLLGNAVKFTKQGGVRVRARSCSQDGRLWLELTVKDSGPGIPPEDLHTIFDPFVQTGAKADVKGTGLGLT
ncbi:sensor histidine kinase, partial [Vibrio sp.]|uniref:sensor histidine kinase n=1 Tax=Vibrio sp. TaxID=678 RepID=UPI003D0CA100